MTINGYYINLESRDDRKKHMENLIKETPFFSSVKRMDAIRSERYGALGCSLSHVKALNLLLQQCSKDDKYIIILEDDFEIIDNENFDKFVESFDKIKDDKNWDLITLTPKGGNNYDEFELKSYGFERIYNSQTTTGYIIKKNFIKNLISQIYFGIQKMTYGLLKMKNISNLNLSPYHCDNIWKPLQLKYKFMYYSAIFGSQIDSYSDIEKKNVSYRRQFLKMTK